MGTAKDKETSFLLCTRALNGVFQVKQHDVLYQAFHYLQYPIPLTDEDGPFDEKTDIELRAYVSASTTKVTGGFDILLMDK